MKIFVVVEAVKKNLPNTYHLSDAKAMPEIMKRYQIVVFVHFKDELL